jgi:hypothetical protein
LALGPLPECCEAEPRGDAGDRVPSRGWRQRRRGSAVVFLGVVAACLDVYFWYTAARNSAIIVPTVSSTSSI